ncbi:alpha/beta hydrolase [Roseomonas sp. E05]|uniref:alpha/beta fold hydrolase n=1 Tax=Roseomonas sp. E05 TaxID=3046310 RepID=UPI0024BA364D|nr:alpha/beta hydrolase [Roseomonas sp. E05]MDJ0390839.1 alpha/beta hydrolase [Roseomonas sp. E05]
MRPALLLAASLLLGASPTLAQPADSTPPYGARLEGFTYPYPTRDFALTSQRQALSMGYMDVRPERPNGRSIVLLHGKNFCGATWEATIGVLRDQGWRVIVPDQIGFCRSTKPEGYQFSLHQLAANTHALLHSLGIERAVVMGHSMGGMLAARYALTFPEATEALVMVNPIGLEDWEAKGVPYQTVDQWLAGERKTTAAGIRNYQRNTYYAGTWEPRYDRWVEMLAGMYAGSGREAVMWNQALTSDMVFTQPVVQDFPRIRVPTLLLIGEKDNTAIGKGAAPPEVQARIGNYAELGPRTAEAIPNARLVRFPELGHSPQIQAPERFHEALLRELPSLK